MAEPIPLQQPPEPFDAGDPEKVGARKKAARLLQARADEALARIMNDVDGRLWVWRLLSACRPFEVPKEANYGSQYFRAGEMGVGVAVFNQIMRVCPGAYLLMQSENVEKPNG